MAKWQVAKLLEMANRTPKRSENSDSGGTGRTNMDCFLPCSD